ncbi:MAG TPA: carbohydrate porin [Kofleriaceae bacterium]
MRFARLAVMLAFGASPAWAQPVAGEGSGEAPVEPPSPTPEVAKAPIEVPPRPEPDPPKFDSTPIVLDDKDVHFSAPPHRDAGFRFGSYGRVLAGSDLRGGKPEQVSVVGHGPRIVEDSYLELEFSYGFERERGNNHGGSSYIIVRPVITLAFDGTLFHDTGEFDAQPALRNMFLDARVRDGLTLWAGSRMYRGDDIYLFDYWPLDDINTVGAGIQYAPRVHILDEGDESLQGGAHVGFNRLNDEFQFQEIDVANPVQGATTVEQLNRQRVVSSASLAYLSLPDGDGIGAKLKVHGEYHALPSGTRKRMDGTLEPLPADKGFLLGAQLGAFGFSSDKRFRRHVNLFMRYAKGLAAFDELAPPMTFGPELKTSRANELTFGASANWDFEFANVMFGALSRRFVDADTNSTDPDDGWEYAIDVRPLLRVASDFFVGGDVSYQARFPQGLNPITLRASDPAVFQLAPMFVWSPMGPSGYDRPQLRFVYRAAHLNQAALDLYVPDDPRHDDTWVHFLGVQAEWWFNSSTYR